MSHKPIFFDPTGRRGLFLRWAVRIAAVFAVVTTLGFAISLAITHSPIGSTTGAVAALLTPRPPARLVSALLMDSAGKLSADLRDEQRDIARAKPTGAAPVGSRTAATIAMPAGRGLSIGFYVNWDDNSLAAMKTDLPHLDWVIPAWLSLEGKDLALKTDVDGKALGIITSNKPGTPVLPMIQNASNGVWDGAGLAKLLADHQARAGRLKSIIDFLELNRFQGLTVDFEEVPTAAQPDLRSFMREISAAFKPLGLTLALTVPYDDDDWDYKTFSAIADYLILMAYDQHWEEGTPGPIAAQDWFEATLDRRMKELDPSHTIIAIGGYGYDWVKGQTATDLTFQDALQAARDSEADIQFDPNAENPHFSYIEDNGKTHDVW